MIVICKNNLGVSYPQTIFFLVTNLSKSLYFGITHECHKFKCWDIRAQIKERAHLGWNGKHSNWEGPHFDFCPPAPTS